MKTPNACISTKTGQKGEELFAGYALLGGRLPTKRIFQMAVSLKYRSKGIGELLVEKVFADAKKPFIR